MHFALASITRNTQSTKRAAGAMRASSPSGESQGSPFRSQSGEVSSYAMIADLDAAQQRAAEQRLAAEKLLDEARKLEEHLAAERALAANVAALEAARAREAEAARELESGTATF